ncbi:MAG TPA: hypothetical protein VHB20_06370 [Verrucomicrobiae bacterium]|jgi:hypothetical protein|nr:hypothetical protein [Verrucomicrobiae bacterium]
MKNWMFGLSLLAVILCGFLWQQKNRELTMVTRRDNVLAAEAAQDKKWARRLQAQLQATRRGAASADSPGSVAHPNPLFRDPQMKQALEEEAAEGIKKNVARLFQSGLTNRLRLSATQSQTLQELTAQKAAIFWQQMLLPLMTGEISDADMPAAGQALRQAYESNQAQMRALLGDEGMGVYDWFAKTQAARDELAKFQGEGSADAPSLTDQQAAQLTAVMEQEYATFKSQYELDDPSKMDLEHWRANFTEEKLEVVGQELEDLNDRIMQNSQTMLTPEQAAAFREFLAKQRLRGAFVMRSTTALFANSR